MKHAIVGMIAAVGMLVVVTVTMIVIWLYEQNPGVVGGLTGLVIFGIAIGLLDWASEHWRNQRGDR